MSSFLQRSGSYIRGHPEVLPQLGHHHSRALRNVGNYRTANHEHSRARIQVLQRREERSGCRDPNFGSEFEGGRGDLDVGPECDDGLPQQGGQDQ